MVQRLHITGVLGPSFTTSPLLLSSSQVMICSERMQPTLPAVGVDSLGIRADKFVFPVLVLRWAQIQRKHGVLSPSCITEAAWLSSLHPHQQTRHMNEHQFSRSSKKHACTWDST